MNNLPELFIDRLNRILPSGDIENVLRSFETQRPVTVRINSIKKDPDEVREILENEGIGFRSLPWNENALILTDIPWEKLRDNVLFNEGILYRQGLSSVLIPVLLDAKPGEDILDMCAAPGSKTTQIASMMGNTGSIVALENIKNRYYKLRSVISLLGARNISIKLIDARKFRSDKLFDRILVDAPCSSEGRFNLLNKKTYAYWSHRKILEMRKKQRGILLNAFRLLKKNGILVYSTCTFAPEENEGSIDWLFKKTTGEIELEKICLKDIKLYPCVPSWKNKVFDPQVKNCIRVLPDDLMDGFFAAKIKRL